ncbi:hypothetical protein SDC9_163484 [bioreactor metagenome]|uniref:Uncharacterized protein n=1 Tax=bioreactor metagenome TaxID=1076179 RepID=A0A645FR05_9ZZZZ
MLGQLDQGLTSRFQPFCGLIGVLLGTGIGLGRLRPCGVASDPRVAFRQRRRHVPIQKRLKRLPSLPDAGHQRIVPNYLGQDALGAVEHPQVGLLGTRHHQLMLHLNAVVLRHLSLAHVLPQVGSRATHRALDFQHQVTG